MIFNNRTARLSALDMEIVRSVPEGGNWKNIPESIPSKRLEQIREGFRNGKGSRSTYYGRLHRNRPSYTINTYFNRPGNGCHMHYEQDRVLSQREAARLQSFPDSFEFLGNQGEIHTQIGNAVPPLLAFQIAKTLGTPGLFVDLFAGSGGMGLGFTWAEWMPVVANDIKPNFLATYARNIHNETIAGSLTNADTFEKLVDICTAERVEDQPFWVLGGPPCQGFSTAGNKRTMEDPRNHLVWEYMKFLERVQPDGFVFENVTGLLNMEQGKVFATVRSAFADIFPSIGAYVLSSEKYGIPQRRKRVFLVGKKDPDAPCWIPPEPFTKLEVEPSLFSSDHLCVSVEEALSDLPPLAAGEDGSGKPYLFSPVNVYQALMRGLLSPQEYIARIKQDDRSWKC